MIEMAVRDNAMMDLPQVKTVIKNVQIGVGRKINKDLVVEQCLTSRLYLLTSDL
jgi:hypothetical protein